jgi:SOS-response transcriptional repressor LexA
MIEPHDRLRKAREKAGFDSPKAASDFHGWSEHTYKSHENGNRGIKPIVAKKYADAFKVSASWIITGEAVKYVNNDTPEVFTVPVYGAAAGGVWMENEDEPIDDVREIPVTPDLKYPLHAQYARRVVGNSVSNRIRDGEHAIFVKYDNYPGGPSIGSLVDVERIRAGLREHTVKVFMGSYLQSDSAELTQQAAQTLTNGESDTEVRIVGIAIGVYRSL